MNSLIEVGSPIFRSKKGQNQRDAVQRYASGISAHIFLIILLCGLPFVSCFSTLPVINGAANLDKGETDAFISWGLSGGLYEYWRGQNDNQNTMLAFGPGIRYGLLRQVNIGMFLWTSIADIGASPLISFELFGGEHKLNLCLRGNVSTSIFDEKKTIEVWGLPELTIGFNEYVFLGVRYEYRWRYVWTEKSYSYYNKTRVEPGSETSKIPMIAGFAGTENIGVFRWVAPYIMVHFEVPTQLWQLSIGATYHFFHKKKT